MKIYVHIGLPKTATTTIQRDIFQQGHGWAWNYWGVRQPRDISQRYEFRALLKAINDKKIEFNSSKSNDDLPIVVSEELITIDDEILWQDKIQNLSRVLKDHDVTILLTIRRPIEGAFSLFAERYIWLEKEYQSFKRFIIESNQAKIFDYHYIITFLERLYGRNKVSVIPFESIHCGELANQICSVIGVCGDSFEIGHTNKKKRNGTGSIVRELTLEEFCKIRLLRTDISRSVQNLILKVLKRLHISRIVMPWSAIEIEKPEDSGAIDIYTKSNQWLYEEKGIDYT